MGVLGLGRGTKVGFLLWANMKWCASLTHLVASKAILGASHDDLGVDFNIEATHKAFCEGSISHLLHAGIQVLKGNNKILYCSKLFQLGETL